MISIRWCIIFSIGLLLPGVAQACYWYPEAESYRYSAFNPLGIPTSPYRPFFFTANFLIDYNNKAGQESDRDRNIKEWNKYLHGQVPEKDIYNLLYRTNAKSLIEINENQHPLANDSLRSNRFYQYLLKPQNKKLYEYISFSKKCEAFTSYPLWTDPWEEDDVDTAALVPLLLQSEQTLQLPLDSFLHQRYVFQYIRLNYYSGGSLDVANIYEKEFANSRTTSILKPWAMLYYANCLVRLNKIDQACYYYAKVFNSCNEKKNAAFLHFDSKRVNAVLALAKNNDERADVIALASLKRPDMRLPDIMKVASLSPNHRALELMITREVNKCEDGLMTREINGFDPSVNFMGVRWDNGRRVALTNMETKERSYAQQLFDFLKNCTNDKRFSNQAFLNIAAAHVAFTIKDDKAALQYVTAAEKLQKNAPEGIQLQIQLTRLMAEARMTPTIDKGFENRIYASVQWLQKHGNQPDASRMLQQFMAFLASNYLHQNDIGKATLCRALSKTYYEVPNVSLVYFDEYEIDSVRVSNIGAIYLDELGNGDGGAQLIALLEQPNKTPFEKLLCLDFNANPQLKNQLLDVVGTLYLREDSLPEALHFFSKIPATYWHEPYGYRMDRYEYLDANSFYARMGDNHRCCAADTVTYNKYTFTYRLLSLKNEISKTHDAKKMLTVAHAYYNMTNWGNSWQLVRGYQSNMELHIHHTYNEHYLGCKRATENYQKALEAATDKETKAACLAMLAQCEKNREYWNDSKGKEYYNWDSRKQFSANKYFTQLVSDYGDTKYFAEIIDECYGRDNFIHSFRHMF